MRTAVALQGGLVAGLVLGTSLLEFGGRVVHRRQV